MDKISKHIEIVSSTDTSLSSMGAQARTAILTVLKQHYTNVGITIVNNLAQLESLVSKKPDLVFTGMKFIPMHEELGFGDPEKIWVSQYLTEHGIEHTGSKWEAYEYEFNKPLAKQRVREAGQKTAAYFVASQGDPIDKKEHLLVYPLFVKPTNLGGGEGIDSASVVRSSEELHSKILSLSTELGSDALVEELLPGREFSVAILREEFSTDYLVMPLELIAPRGERGVRLLTAAIKKADTEVSKAVQDTVILEQVSVLAFEAFKALGARDYGRIDIRLDKQGVPHFLEANLVPGLRRSTGNYFPRACLLNYKLDYETIILRIVRVALTRHQTGYGGANVKNQMPSKLDRVPIAEG